MLRRFVFGVLGLAVLGLAFVLVPPHLQIRAIAPALPTAAELRALASEPDGPVRVEYLNVATQEIPDGALGHNVFLLSWADGRTFMIDAGMDRAGADEFAELLVMIMGGGEHAYAGDVAALLGDGVARVAGVGFTHLHIDHTQGVTAFCRARAEGARVYQTEWQAEEHNLHTAEGAGLVADSCLEPKTLRGEGLQRIAAFPGLGMVALGGHTPGSTLFAAAVDGHLWLFSGDITNSKADLLDDEGKGFVYSGLMVPEDTGRTAELRSWLRTLDRGEDATVVVSHDIEDIRASALAAYGAPG